MYDIHSHILPGVDDGAVDIEDSIEICRASAAFGVKTIAATPHFIEGETTIKKADYFKILNALKDALSISSIKINIVSGMEVYFTPNIVELIKNEDIITLNDKKYVLIEFPLFDSIPSYTDNVLFELQLAGYKPIIAHPERCRCFASNLNLVYRLIEKGSLMQINSGSLAGSFGSSAKSSADSLLKHNMVHSVASDNHSSKNRMASLKDGYKIIKDKYGFEVAIDLFVNNNEKILNGEDFYTPDPIRPHKKKNIFSFLK